MTVRVHINGSTLAWARMALNLDPSDLGSAAGVTAQQVELFESEGVEPTYVQLQKLARKLDRPVAFFFTSVPNFIDVPQAADFRGRTDAALSSQLLKEMKRADSHRLTMLDLIGQPSEQVVVGRIDWSNVEQRAALFRQQLGLAPNFRPPESQAGAVFNFWRGLLENYGYLVFQTTGVPLSEFRGLSIHHDAVPIILVNGADSPNGRVYTLFHEVAHLANRTSGLCVLNEKVKEEALCNAFAADFLMPAERVRKLLQHAGSALAPVEALVREFRVSILASAVRLKTLGIIGDLELQRIWAESDEQWARARKRQAEGDGFVPPWRLRYRDLGPSYLGAVFNALEEDRLNYLDASYLLDARVPMIEQMQAEYHRRGGQ